MRIAGFPWYDLPETQPAHDALWSVLAGHLRRQGVPEVPRHLSHDLPVPGIFTDPRLLIAQCCGYDLIYGFASCLRLVATPRYNAPGCDGADYSSCVLVRSAAGIGDLEGLRGSVCVVNSFNSHSGTNALRPLVAPLSRAGRFFSAVKVSGGHQMSLAMLCAGEADVMAMDGILYGLLCRHRAEALDGTGVLCWSDPAPAPPFVTSASADDALLERLRRAIADALRDDASREARAALLLDGVAMVPLESYATILDSEGVALRHRYSELHATSAARVPVPGPPGPR